jgi:hypothetical protein
MRYSLLHISFILFFTGFAISSCKEDHVGSIPVINISSPYKGQEYFIPDTITVKAYISNDIILGSIQVGLVNEQFISVGPVIYLVTESNNFNLELDYPLIQTSLETGNYYLYIRAESENEFKNKYQSIHITGAPKVLENIIVLTKKDVTSIEVSAVDSDSNTEFLFEIKGDYSSSETDSKNRLLYVAGYKTFDIQTYNLENKEIEWQRTAFPPLPVHTTDCFYFDEGLYASYASYYIYGFRYNGSLIFNTTVEESKIPSRIMKIKEFLLADLQSKTTGFTYLATYYISTGAEKQRIQTNYKVVDFYDAGGNNILIIGNQDSQGVIWLFDPWTNIQTFLQNVQGKIICSVNLSEESFLLSVQDKVLFFKINPVTLTEILDGQILYRLRLDPINQKIYAAGEKQLFVLGYPEIKIQNAISFPDSILNLHLFYNR